MLEIRNTEVFGLERAIKASGNPMVVGEINTKNIFSGLKDDTYTNDHKRASKLGSAERGSGHDNFLSGILVQCDIKYPQYWSPEFQRYHFAQIISSQSKMHRLTTMGKDANFSSMFNKYVNVDLIEYVKGCINLYNSYDNYKQQEDGLWVNDTPYCVPRTTDELKQEKYETFMRCISNLPMGFEMYMTISTNYLQLKTIYFQRKNHKLREDWSVFCDWCLQLPMFKELIGIK